MTEDHGGHEIQRALGRIEGRLDSIEQLLNGSEKRLSHVERKVWYGTGIAAAVALFISNLRAFFH